MATFALRLRRAVYLSSCMLNHHKPLCSTLPALPAPPQVYLYSQNPNLDLLDFPFQSRAFRASNVSLSSRPGTSYRDKNEDNKISPDEILFEGCDYNHWLITMDFPKDPKPSPEEMVETYVQTAAKVLGSVEEAKKKIYACSTTTYNGFQVEVSEEMSEKFKGLPGVVFVLPDSYIDPVNKEYGGDKYINGTIIPRPPPISFARSGGRYGDRNRDYNRPSQPRGPYQQGNSTFDNQGSMQGDARNFGPPQNPPPQQNYGPPRAGPSQQNYDPARVGVRRDPMPMSNSPVGRENYQGDRRDPLPSYQGNYSQGQRGNFYPQGQRGFPPVEQANYVPPEQKDFRVDNRNYASPSPQGGGFGQGAGGNFGQGTGGNYGQGGGGNYGQGGGGNYRQGAGGNYGQGAGGNFGQGAGGNFGQGADGNFGQGAGGNFGQGAGGNFGQGAGGNFGQGAGGNFGQGAGGNFGQGVGRNNGQGVGRNNGQGVGRNNGQGVGGGLGQGLGGVPGQETGTNYRHSYSGQGENQSFQQLDQINMQEEQQERNYVATGQSGTEHGIY